MRGAPGRASRASLEMRNDQLGIAKMKLKLLEIKMTKMEYQNNSIKFDLTLLPMCCGRLVGLLIAIAEPHTRQPAESWREFAQVCRKRCSCSRKRGWLGGVVFVCG